MAAPAPDPYTWKDQRRFEESFSWLPLHLRRNCIVGIGSYVLPEPLILPAGAVPYSSAWASLHFIEPREDAKNIFIFFPSADERVVKKWASGEPDMIPPARRLHWLAKFASTLGNTTQNPRDAHWFYGGTAVTRKWQYMFMWQCDAHPEKPTPGASDAFLQGETPLKNEPRILSFVVVVDLRHRPHSEHPAAKGKK